jgi:hypothetical protein
MEAAAMNDSAEGHARRVCERDDLLVVLLLLQSVVGLVGLLGLLVIGIAAGFPVITLAGTIVLAGFVVPLVLSAGMARGRRWARRAATVYETLALVSVGINLLLALSPDVQMDLTLTGLLTSVALPAAIIGLLNAPQPAVVTAPDAVSVHPVRRPGQAGTRSAAPARGA